jgi:hypothetical protein
MRSKKKEDGFREVLEKSLGELKSSKGSHFYLFEESHFWYAAVHEIIKRKELHEDLTVFIFGNSVRVPMVSQIAWIKFQGGLFKNYNLPKYLVRTIMPKVFPRLSPAYVLKKSLTNSKVRVIDFSELRVSRLHTPELSKHNLYELFEKVSKSLIGEMGSTEYVEKYFSPKYINKRIESAIATYEVINEILINVRVDRVYYMNGRMLHERAALEAAKQNQIVGIAFESNMYGDRIQEFKGSIANSKDISSQVEEFWKLEIEEKGIERVTRLAEFFFEERMKNTVINPFLRNMGINKPHIPINSKRIYSYFTSSSEELNTFYNMHGLPNFDQEKLVLDLIELFKQPENKEFQLIIRVHPNLTNKRSEDKKFFKNLNGCSNVKVFSSNSRVNSYELIMVSDFVLYSSSTVGLESAFLKIPTFNFARTFWDDLSVSRKIEVPSDIFHVNPNDIEASHLQALKFALFNMYGGSGYVFTNIKQMSDINNEFFFDPLQRLIYRRAKFMEKAKLV